MEEWPRPSPSTTFLDLPVIGFLLPSLLLSLARWRWLHLPAFPQGVKRLLGIQQAGWEGRGEGEEAGGMVNGPGKGWNKAPAGEAPGRSRPAAGWEAPPAAQEVPGMSPECWGLSPHGHLQSAEGLLCFLPANRHPAN